MSDFSDFDLRPRGAESAVLSYKDALIACTTPDHKWFISSPNAHWILQPVIGIVDVRVRADGRYGTEDPLQWPQVYCNRFAHFTTFRQPKDDPNDPTSILWWTPTEAEFVPVEGSVIWDLGHLYEEKWDRLRLMVASCTERVDIFSATFGKDPSRLQFADSAMRLGLACLKNTPTMFRDMLMQVTGVQRYAAEAYAWMDWVEEIQPFISSAPRRPVPIRSQYIGAFTTDPAVAQKLFLAGVPVWYMRQRGWVTEDDIIRAVAAPIAPRHVVVTGDLTGESVYFGSVGWRHLGSMFRGGHTYTDIERTPFPDMSKASVPQAPPSRGLDQAGSLHTIPASSRQDKGDARLEPYPSSKQHAHRGRVQPQLNLPHSAWLPEPIPVWRRAVARLDYSGPCIGKWDHFVPPAYLFVGPKDATRGQKYLKTWLRTRGAWLRVLDDHLMCVPRQLKTQQWCDYFYDFLDRKDRQNVDTASQKRRKALQEMFGTLYPMSSIRPNPTTTVVWRHLRFTHDEQIPILPIRQILWELCEVGFRQELLELDRVLCPNEGGESVDLSTQELSREMLLARAFPADVILGVGGLTQRNVGLQSQHVFGRACALDGLIKVMRRWPECPAAIKTAPILEGQLAETLVMSLEETIVDFYCATFFRHAARAPTIPCYFPLS